MSQPNPVRKGLWLCDVTVKGTKYNKVFEVILIGNDPDELMDCFLHEFHFTMLQKEMETIKTLKNREIIIKRKSKHGQTN